MLDVGCGDGLFLKMLADNGIHAEGADMSAVAVGKCNQKGLKAKQASELGKLPFPNGSFDVVSILDVLEHTFFPLDLLKEASRIAPTVVVSTPNFASADARISALAGRVPRVLGEKKGHVYYMTLGKLLSLIGQAGLKPEARKFYFYGQERVVGGLLKTLLSARPSFFATEFVIRASRRR